MSFIKKDYKNLYLKYKSKYLELKSSSNCKDYDLDPKGCESNPNCEWDFRRICLPKGKAVKLPEETAGLVGSYLENSNTRHKFLLDEINKNLNQAEEYAKKGNKMLTQRSIDKINDAMTKVDNLSIEKSIDITEKIINIRDILNQNEKSVESKKLTEKRSSPINKNETQRIQFQINKIKILKEKGSTLFEKELPKLENLIQTANITDQEREDFQTQLNDIKSLDETSISDAQRKYITDNLKKAREFAFKGNLELMNNEFRRIRLPLDRIRLSDPDFYQKKIEEIDNIKTLIKVT